MKAKAFSGRRPLYDVDDNEGGTFVTGVGIPGRREATDDQNEEGDNKEEYKYYQYPEDELLDKVDKYESEMQDMMKYLCRLENLMAGDDLKEIGKMIDCTRTTVDKHSKAFDNLKS